MKELSIYISQLNMNGFSYTLKKNSLLLYSRIAKEEDSFSSIIESEVGERKEEVRVNVIWNNRGSLLIPSIYFRIDNLHKYIGYISSLVYEPQCIQYGELVAVWNTDERINEFNKISSELGISILHSHQRVEHIANTPDDTISFTLYDNLLYISEKANGLLINSFVAEIYDVNDVLYYLVRLTNKKSNILISVPKDWESYINKNGGFFNENHIRFKG